VEAEGVTLPKPYYEDARNGITIYHGDCREILPHLGKFDLLLTDPPYGIGEAAGRNKSRSLLAVSRDYGDEDWDDAPPTRETLDLCRGACTHQIIFGGNYFDLAPSSCWLVWDKDNGENDFADCELAWTNMSKAVRRKRYRWQGMLQEPGRRKEQRLHPTQKPLEVISWALGHAPTSVATVLDPFMGSGTTLRAAKNRSLRAVGIDRIERYCEIAAKRLAQEVLFA
jgi:DNA modification methylase